MAHFTREPYPYFAEVVAMLQDADRMKDFLQLMTNNDPKAITRHFAKMDYEALKENVDTFIASSIPSDASVDEYFQSPLVTQVGNHLEESFKNGSSNISEVLAMAAWLTFYLERIISRLEKKLGGPSGDEALEEHQKRRANSGCPQAPEQPVDPSFEKRVLEEVEKASLELQKKNDSLEEKNALLERRIATLEQEKRASDDEEMREKVRLLEKEKNEATFNSTQPVEHDFEKSVREQVDNATRLWQGKMAEMGDIEELRKKNELLEEKKALLEKRIATLEQETRASAEMKDKFIQKIKELNKTEAEMRERVKVLEEEKAAWDEAAEEWRKEVPLEEKLALLEKSANESRPLSENMQKELLKVEQAKAVLVKKVEESRILSENLKKELLKLKEEKISWEKDAEERGKGIHQLEEEKSEFNEKHKKSLGLLGEETHLQKNAREIHLESDFVNLKNTVLERKLKENEAEREMMKNHREDMAKLLDQKNQALEVCHREKMKMIEDFHLEVKLIDRLHAFSEVRGALEELKKRRANSGCPQAPAQPVDPFFEKRVREEADKIVRPIQEMMAELGDIGKLRKKKDSLEEKNALLGKRIATLEQENRASAEMKDKFMEKIKELNMTVKVLEEEKAQLVKNAEKSHSASGLLKQELLKLTEEKPTVEKDAEERGKVIDQLEEKIMEFNEKHKKSLGLLGEENKKQAETIAHLQKNAREIHLETDFVNIKNTVLERKLKENEAEREMMKKQREDMHRLLDQRNQALEECHRENLKMIEDFHLEVKLIDRLHAFSEKFYSLEPENYKTELLASLGKLKPGICDFDSPEWIELESQLLVPFLMGKELAKKKKAEGEDLYNQIGDHFAHLGIHIDP